MEKASPILSKWPNVPCCVETEFRFGNLEVNNLPLRAWRGFRIITGTKLMYKTFLCTTYNAGFPWNPTNM